MSIEGIPLAQFASKKMLCFLMVALLDLCVSTRANAQVIVVTRPSDGFFHAGGRVAFVRRPPIIGVIGGIGPSTYVGLAAILPPPNPPAVIVPPARLTIYNYYAGPAPILGPGYGDETRGVDLDLVPAKKPASPATPDSGQKLPAQETSKELPGVQVSKSRPSVRPEPDKPGALPPPKLPAPPEPLADPVAESWRQIDAGVAMLQAGEYGLAAQRFRQATELAPKKSQAHFLLSQAEFAMGNYRQAVAAIQAGMKIDKQWPLTPIRPRLDLYGGREAEYTDQMKLLSDALAAQPDQATLMFLAAHQLWFDGQRGAALALLQRARPLTNDTAYIDAFLAAGGVGQLAAN